MKCNWRKAESEGNVHICSLRYRSPEAQPGPCSGEVILIAIQANGHLKLFTRRGLRQQVSERDRVYFDDLLSDLQLRAEDAAEDVFAQLSGLSVGPMVTDGVEMARVTDGEFFQRYPEFCLFENSFPQA